MKQFMQTIKQPLPLNPSHASFLEDAINKPLNTVANRYQYNPVVGHWLESVAGSETYRERNCRSATISDQSENEPVSTKRTKSAPDMINTRNSDGYTMPNIPDPSSRPLSNAEDISQNALSATASSDSSRKMSLVQTPFYRMYSLASNNIFMQYTCDEHIVHLVNEVRIDLVYPGPSLNQLREDTKLKALEMESTGPDVRVYFETRIFTRPSYHEVLDCSGKVTMNRQVVPDTGSNYSVSTPAPDLLYGYKRRKAFTEEQQAQLVSLGFEMIANASDVLYPFLNVEFKGDGFWIGEFMASCINIVDRLNRRLQDLKEESVPMITNVAFSITMTGTEARVYISWMHDDVKCYMAKVESFLLQRAEDFIEFHKIVLNIIDWGKGNHLNEIRKALDILIQRG
ncbi:hypothetical protein CJF32_00009485 [Rutstroemia sp. NJR-2017a WRK4]|nr:hypothetical protein CJF32_00009485 [Rutstroemia sp. NJR-2017a WRK4]